MKIAITVLVMFLAGCAAPMSTVYGKSGKKYTAPDLCAAQLACMKAGEETCSYVDTVEIDEQGNKMSTYCKMIKGAGK